MPEMQRPLSQIQQGTMDYFGALPKPAKEVRAELADVDRTMVQKPLSDKDVNMLIQSRALKQGGNHRRGPSVRAKVFGLALSGAALVASPVGEPVREPTVNAVNEFITNDNDTLKPVQAGSPEAGVYSAQPGDNPSNVTARVETNVDGVRGNQETREFSDDLVDQAGSDGMQIGEDFTVPKVADEDPNTPGVQL